MKSKTVTVDSIGNEIITYAPKKNIFPEYYIINVERFKDIVEEDIDEWIYILKNSKIKKEFKSKYIKDAELHLDLGKLDKKERRQYEKHLESLAIEKDVMSTAHEEGKEEGRKEEKIEIAKNLLGLLEDSIIAEKTGLSLEDIMKLKRK